jgi:hypothetical protein
MLDIKKQQGNTSRLNAPDFANGAYAIISIGCRFRAYFFLVVAFLAGFSTFLL